MSTNYTVTNTDFIQYLGLKSEENFNLGDFVYSYVHIDFEELPYPFMEYILHTLTTYDITSEGIPELRRDKVDALHKVLIKVGAKQYKEKTKVMLGRYVDGVSRHLVAVMHSEESGTNLFHAPAVAMSAGKDYMELLVLVCSNVFDYRECLEVLHSLKKASSVIIGEYLRVSGCEDMLDTMMGILWSRSSRMGDICKIEGMS